VAAVQFQDATINQKSVVAIGRVLEKRCDQGEACGGTLHHRWWDELSNEKIMIIKNVMALDGGCSIFYTQ
jgi:hypothetical protein